ncbi:MAG: hypothetical protein J6P03_06645 [Opitutales bacterium]|nr:hypothetical protein [Opitutales bacterium]
MKRTITGILSTIAIAASAIAIEQSQIDAANAITANGPIEVNTELVNTFKPILDVGLGDAEAYVALAKAHANNIGRWNYCAGKTAETLGIEIPAALDDYLSGGAKPHARAIASREYYEALKARNFKAESGYKMAEYRIEMLALNTYADPEAALKFVGEKTVARDFDKLLKAVRRARLGAEAKYKLLSKIATDFEQYKETIKPVADNWESLQADKNEAFMDCYAEAKLNSLNK